MCQLRLANFLRLVNKHLIIVQVNKGKAVKTDREKPAFTKASLSLAPCS